MTQKRLWIVLLAALAGNASAEVTVFTSRAAWQTAAGAVTTIDFTTAAKPPAGSYKPYPPPGLTLLGVNFSSLKPGGSIAVISQSYCCPTYARGYDQADSDSGFQITLPPGTTAFGLDLFTVVGGNEAGTNQDIVDVVIAGQKYPVTTRVAPNNAFIGFVSSSPIPSLSIMADQVNSPPQINIMNVSFRVAPTGPAPTVTGVSNAGDFSSHLAPGLLAAVFGTNFGSGPASGVTVTVGGKQAYVVFVAANQLTIQLPTDAPTGPTTLTVTIAGASSTPFPVTLDSTAPAILSANGSGTGLGLIRTAANVNVTSSAPAKPGDNLVAYAVGLGATNPPTPTGTTPSAAIPTAATAALTVGGMPAVVTYAGVAPGLVATYQVNFTVPANLQGTQPVVLTIGGKSSTPMGLALFGISSVVNNASFASAGTTAPGSIASVFANGLGSTDQSVGFPATTFQGVSVTFNGTPAPIFHLTATQGQIDLLVPYELPASGSVNVQLKTPSGTSLNYTLAMAPAVPGLYFLPDPGTKTRFNVLAQFNNTVWLAIPDATAAALKIPGNCTAANVNPLSLCGQPAAPGDYLVLYATGLGKATPNGDPNGTPLKTGEIPPANGSVLYQTVAKPDVTVGGLPALVVFSGLAPGFPGLYQIDFQVPGGVTGDDVPVAVSIAGSPVDTRTLAIHPR